MLSLKVCVWQPPTSPVSTDIPISKSSSMLNILIKGCAQNQAEFSVNKVAHNFNPRHIYLSHTIGVDNVLKKGKEITK